MFPEDQKSAKGWDMDLAIENHANAQAADPVWLDEAVSDYCFLGGNHDREREYRLALWAIHANRASYPMLALIEKAIYEKAEKEVNQHQDIAIEAADAA